MSIIIVILIGAVVGYALAHIKSSGFGLWWDVFFGAAGAVLASFVMLYAYFLSAISLKVAVGLNLQSIVVDAAGAFVFVYGAWFINQAFQLMPRKVSLGEIGFLVKKLEVNI